MNTITIEAKTRPCRVGDRAGLFHMWEQRTDIVLPSFLRGGHSGGPISRAFAVVEFASGVERVEITDVVFTDDIPKMLEYETRKLQRTKEEQ